MVRVVSTAGLYGRGRMAAVIDVGTADSIFGEACISELPTPEEKRRREEAYQKELTRCREKNRRLRAKKRQK